MGQPPSEQGDGERDTHVRKVLGARAGRQFSYPQLFTVSTWEIIRVVHLRQQNWEEGSVFKIGRACMNPASLPCML